MTEVIGITDALRSGSGGSGRLRRIGDLSAVMAPEGGGRTPRDRLRLQVACAGQLPSFLPFAPVRECDARLVERWLAPRSEVVGRWLERFRGRVQVAVLVDVCRPPPPERPRDWLRQRAETARHRRDAVNALARQAAMLGAIGAVVAADAGRLDLLCDRAGLEGLVAGLKEAGWVSSGAQARAHVTGPWPVFAFASLRSGA